ncbi:MAG: tail fiber domain-containing protein [Candidatus Marinimicrobia bacterium]|nr:tail fiber domain-containing protein [Candidatus Neomarinimicrobiota bacterium]MCF7828304.1 tail fiber domain-containing protein [Candidatus Neomarinimicrobiota bacterium]MCF7879521.1 tail fiber domain-containing protein [Candidatus Neomarinimicrobiota bacterium]
MKVMPGIFSGDVHVTGEFTNPSDIKLKENIQPVGSVLGKLKQLQAKSFNYKRNDPRYKPMNLASGKRVGFIAQNMEKLFPELVSEDAFIDPEAPGAEKAGEEPEPIKYKSINYIELIPVLVQAIQEQQQEIEALKQEINQGKNR